MMADMTDEVEFCDHTSKISESVAKDQLTTLANLHAYYYESEKLKKDFNFLISWNDFFTITINEAGFGPQAKIGFLEAKSVIPSRLFKKAEQIWPATLLSVKHHDALPATLIHSDVHLKNWYITGDNKMGLCDWQCICVGHWARDLAYVISTSLAIEDRRNWEKDLIQFYLAELAKFGGPIEKFDTAWKYYKQNLFGALAWWTPVLCPNPDVPDMQPPATCLEFINRITTAIDDTDALNSF